MLQSSSAASTPPLDPIAHAAASVVLLVGAIKEVQFVIANWLRSAGYEVIEAASGRDAIACASERVDLAILDLDLPDMHGFEVARCLREDPRTTHLSMLYLSTAPLDAVDRVRGLQAGAGRYLVHPVDPAELLATTEAMLRVARMHQDLRQRLAAERAAAERIVLLHTVTAGLVATTTQDEVGTTVLTPLVAALGAEIGNLALLTADGGEFEVLGIVNGREPITEGWRRFPRALETPVAAAMAADHSVSAWDIDAMRLRFPAVAPTLDILGIASVWCIQLGQGDRSAGTMDLCFRNARQPTAEEVALLTATAEQTTVALRRVVFEQSEQRAHAQAGCLQRFTEALSEAPTVEAVVVAADVHATAAFDAVGTVVALLQPDGATLELVRATGMSDTMFDAWRRFPLAAVTPLSDATRTGEAIILRSPADWLSLYPELAAASLSAGHHANAVFPLVLNRQAIGSMGMAFDAPRAFDAEERTLMSTAAHHTAQALERARLYDAERAARAEADAANRAKSDFLAVMSHELRTPLNAIAGYSQLIGMGIHGPVTEAQQDALGRIDRAQQHLLRLVNDVLNFARMESGRVEYVVTSVALAEVVSELEPLVGPQLRAGGLQYVTNVPHDCAVRADREKLVQLLLNLVSNSLKFTTPGGRICVECATRSDGRALPGIVFIRVSDTGIGIPPDKLDAVFDPFVKVDRGMVSHAGAGLGLAISRDLARGMGGDLRVRSTLGVGTTFTVTLPLAP